MINGRSVLVVLLAYNAARTLERTVAEIPREVVDHILLVDDASSDATVEVARRLARPRIFDPAGRRLGSRGLAERVAPPGDVPPS